MRLLKYALLLMVALDCTAQLASTRRHKFVNSRDRVLHLHMDGADASTSFPDESASDHTVTANGSAQVDTGQADPFGTNDGVLLLDGTDDYLSIPDSSDWTLTGDFTMEARFRLTTDTNNQTILSQSTDVTNYTQFLAKNHQGGGVSRVSFVIVDGGTLEIALTSSIDPALDQWYHAMVTRTGDTWSLFVDGVLEATQTKIFSYPDFTGTMDIGDTPIHAAHHELVGFIDEARIIKGTSAHSSDFQPDVTPYW